MKLIAIPNYIRHSAWRNPVPGVPAVHAMVRGEMVIVDLNSFLNARVTLDDVVYPLELGHDGTPLIQVWFGKGGISRCVEMPAYEFKRIFRMDPPKICR